jgi:hypothetical protein
MQSSTLIPTTRHNLHDRTCLHVMPGPFQTFDVLFLTIRTADRKCYAPPPFLFPLSLQTRGQTSAEKKRRLCSFFPFITFILLHDIIG